MDQKPWWQGKGKLRISVVLPSGTERSVEVTCDSAEHSNQLFNELKDAAWASTYGREEGK